MHIISCCHFVLNCMNLMCTVSNKEVHYSLKTFICMIGSASNMFHLVLSWLMGRRPEFTDPKVVAQGEGREGKLI